MFLKIGVKNLRWSTFSILAIGVFLVSLLLTLKDLQLYEKETPTQVFFCEYCQIINTDSEEHLRTAASDVSTKWLRYFEEYK